MRHKHAFIKVLDFKLRVKVGSERKRVKLKKEKREG